MNSQLQFIESLNCEDISNQLRESLPTIEKVTLSSEAQYYGALYEIEELLGLSSRSIPRATWRHGASLEDSYDFPEEIISKDSQGIVHLVHSKDQQVFLREAGYRHAFAIGAPYLYAKSILTRRVIGSTLVMLPHSTKFSNHGANEAQLIKELDRSVPQSRKIWYCVSRTCVDKGCWIDLLSEKKRNIIVGAEAHDRNSLRRMKFLFNLFESVVSPNLGSHLSYASYSGAKVRALKSYLWDRCFHGASQELSQEPFYQKYPWVLEKRMRQSRESLLKFWGKCSNHKEKEIYSSRKLGVNFLRSPRYVGDMLGCFELFDLKARFDRYLRLGAFEFERKLRKHTTTKPKAFCGKG